MALLENIQQNFTEFLSRQKNSSLNEERNVALKKFFQLGFPTKKDEEYRFTNLKEVTEKNYNFFPTEANSISQEMIDELHFGEEDFDWVTFINGKYHPSLSKITSEMVEIAPFEEAENHPEFQEYLNKIADNGLAFTNFNLAYANTGLFVKVPKNAVIEKPIHIFYLSQDQKENSFYAIRNLLVAEEGSHIEIIESHHNYDESFVLTNTVTEIYSGKNAKTDWHKLQNDSDSSYMIDHTFAKQERDSLTTVNTFSFGGKLVRNNLDFIHNGQNINSFMNGITMIGNEQLVDHHTAVHHKEPNCESYQNYKGIYKDQSKGVFNGKVFVDKIAQKTKDRKSVV